MKSIFSIVLGLLLTYVAQAQKCDSYYFLQNGKTVTMTNYGRKDKMTGTVVYKISDVKKTSTGLSATINAQVFNDKNESVSTNETQVQCSAGQYKMDLRMMLNQQQMKQMKNYDATVDFFIEYPNTMKIGDVLKDASFTLESNNKEGLNADLEMNIDERTVMAEERVTTTAGTWNCFKIKSHITMKAIVGSISIPFSTDNMEWFSPEFGVVKSESKSTRTEITSIK